MELNIDATNLILGRLCSYAAKRSLLGDTVKIFNCENALMTGSKANIHDKYKARRKRGLPTKGPYFPTVSDRIVRRTVRGMLPYKKPKGRDALKRIMCYLGVPDEFKKAKLSTVEGADVSKTQVVKYITIGSLSKLLRG
jgi:large subunit ribosomal protein L13